MVRPQTVGGNTKLPFVCPRTRTEAGDATNPSDLLTVAERMSAAIIKLAQVVFPDLSPKFTILVIWSLCLPPVFGGERYPIKSGK